MTWCTDEQVEKAARAIDPTAWTAARDDDDILVMTAWRNARKNARKRARAALSAVNPYEWRPIETAPKGESVLVFSPDASAPQIIIAEFREVIGDPDPGDWYPSWEMDGNGYPIDAEVTHWMPLPPSPEGDK